MKIILFLGRSGCGKGTQAKLLIEKLNYEYIGSGELLRKRSEIDDFTGNKLNKTLEKGILPPIGIVFTQWIYKLDDLKNKRKDVAPNGIIIDGSPRRIVETYLLEEIFDWYNWSDVKFILLDISQEESAKRLRERVGRKDDNNEKSINNRLNFYEKEVVPIIEYLKNKNKLITINGERSIEEINKDILNNI